MYAIIETGAKQYLIENNSKIFVEKLPAAPGSEVTIDKVLLTGGEQCKIGRPYVEGAKVLAEVIEERRGRKVLVFKRRRRKDSKCLHGHRQNYTVLRIKEIMA